MKKFPSTFLLVILFVSSINFASAQINQDPEEQNYVLVWADEFSDEGAVDSEKWHHQTILPDGYPNGFSWYNGEKQHYTNRLENSSVDNGFLKITAIKEQFTDQGHTKSYTSARLNSKFAFTYGRVEVRAKLPAGDGTWPAIWLLGQNITEPGGYWEPTHGTTPWPSCGEIDIMEHWGNYPNEIHGSLHTPSSFGGTINTRKTTIENVSTTFHVYSMIWDEDKIEFSVDGNPFYTYQPSNKNADTWPFDKPQYLLLNVAMGGLFPIDPNFTSSSMEIDYVRVYQQVDIPSPEIAAPTPERAPESVISLFSDAFTNIPLDKWLADWSVGNLEEVSIQDNEAKKYQNVSYVGIESVSNPIDISEMTHVHLHLWTPDATQFRIKLVDFGGNGSHDEAGGDDSEAEIVFENPSQEEWISYDIPLSDFSDLTNQTSLAQIVLSSNPSGSSSFYIDNLYFYNDQFTPETPETVLSALNSEDVSLHYNGTSLDLKFTNPTHIKSWALYDLSGKIYNSQSAPFVQREELKIPVNQKGIMILRLHTEQGVISHKFSAF